MSQAINFPKYSDDDNREGSSTNAASVPLLSRKRLRDKEASSNDAHLRNGSGPGNTTATGTGEFVVDLELEDKVEVLVPPKNSDAVLGKANEVERMMQQGVVWDV
jgi:hypothetical protein